MKSFLVLLALVLSACGNQSNSSSSGSAAPSLPNIPTYNGIELSNLGKVEFEEIERRCMDQPSHTTCQALKSDSFRKGVDLARAFCDGSKSMNRITGDSGMPNNCWRFGYSR